MISDKNTILCWIFIFTTVQTLQRFIIDPHRWSINMTGTKVHQNRKAQSITDKERANTSHFPSPFTHIRCFIYSVCFSSFGLQCVPHLIWCRTLIRTLVHSVSCEPVDTQIMGICFYKTVLLTCDMKGDSVC